MQYLWCKQLCVPVCAISPVLPDVGHKRSVWLRYYQTCVCVCVRARTHACICMCVCVYLHIYIYVYTHFFPLYYRSSMEDMKQNSEGTWSLFWWIIGCVSLTVSIPWLIYQLFCNVHPRCARSKLKDKVWPKL
jgi:hypothetical protein